MKAWVKYRLFETAKYRAVNRRFFNYAYDSGQLQAVLSNLKIKTENLKVFVDTYKKAW